MWVASYLRVSGKSQLDHDGLVRQRDAADRFIGRQRPQEAREFVDEGVSGTKDLEGRPALKEALGWLQEYAGERVLLVESADRLARSLLVSEMLLEHCRAHGVEVIASVSGMTLTDEDGDPVSVMLRQILGAVAQFDKSLFVSRTRVARERIRKKNGKCEGQKAYGTRDGERGVLAKMRYLRNMQGRSYSAIARTLNADQTPTRHGGPWRPSTVHRILTRKAREQSR